jgi:hypothetical protein
MTPALCIASLRAVRIALCELPDTDVEDEDMVGVYGPVPGSALSTASPAVGAAAFFRERVDPILQRLPPRRSAELRVPLAWPAEDETHMLSLRGLVLACLRRGLLPVLAAILAGRAPASAVATPAPSASANDKLTFECCWVLTNLAAGRHDISALVAESVGAMLLRHLADPRSSLAVCTMAAWSIGNCAADSVQVREDLARLGAVAVLLRLTSPAAVGPEESVPAGPLAATANPANSAFAAGALAAAKMCMWALTNFLKGGPSAGVYACMQPFVMPRGAPNTHRVFTFPDFSVTLDNALSLATSAVFWLKRSLLFAVSRVQSTLQNFHGNSEARAESLKLQRNSKLVFVEICAEAGWLLASLTAQDSELASVLTEQHRLVWYATRRLEEAVSSELLSKFGVDVVTPCIRVMGNCIQVHGSGARQAFNIETEELPHPKRVEGGGGSNGQGLHPVGIPNGTRLLSTLADVLASCGRHLRTRVDGRRAVMPGDLGGSSEGANVDSPMSVDLSSYASMAAYSSAIAGALSMANRNYTSQHAAEVIWLLSSFIAQSPLYGIALLMNEVSLPPQVAASLRAVIRRTESQELALLGISLSHGILPLIVYHLHFGPLLVRKEAAWVIFCLATTRPPVCAGGGGVISGGAGTLLNYFQPIPTRIPSAFPLRGNMSQPVSSVEEVEFPVLGVVLSYADVIPDMLSLLSSPDVDAARIALRFVDLVLHMWRIPQEVSERLRLPPMPPPPPMFFDAACQIGRGIWGEIVMQLSYHGPSIPGGKLVEECGGLGALEPVAEERVPASQASTEIAEWAKSLIDDFYGDIGEDEGFLEEEEEVNDSFADFTYVGQVQRAEMNRDGTFSFGAPPPVESRNPAIGIGRGGQTLLPAWMTNST